MDTPPLGGRTALVTGATAGIGLATARALAKDGAQLVLTGRDAQRLVALRAELPDAEVLPLDVRSADNVRAALEDRTFDIVVPNAGLSIGMDTLATGEPEEWSVVVDTNVKGVLHVLRATLPAMLARGRGDVVLIGSVAGRQAYPGGNVYCATKFAVRGLYENLRLDHAGSGLRFTTVDPGMVETDFSRVRFRGDEERAAAVYRGVDPLRPEDVADAIRWAVTRPPNVNVGEIVLWASAQASTTVCTRREG